MERHAAVDAVLARQAGVITLAQAAAGGMSAATVQRRAREGRWRRLYPGVYLAGGHRRSDEARVRAAALWAGDGAAVTGPAAAWWHHMLEGSPRLVDLTIPTRRRLAPVAGVVVRRRDLGGVDLTYVRGVQVASPAFAALETAAALPDGSAFLDRALQRHVRFPALYRSYCRNLGRHGSAGEARLLVAAADRVESAAERLLVRLLRAAGITGWVLGHPVGPWTVDLAFPACRVAVEVDGWAWHVDVERFRNDRRKGNALTHAGWVVLRFTWHDLDATPGAVVAGIRRALRAAA